MRPLALALLLAACGSTVTPAPDTSTDLAPPPTAREYCESTVEIWCGYYVRCGRMAVDSLDACRDTFLETCTAVYQPRYVALEDAGLLELSVDGVAQCADHLDAVACDRQIFDLDGGCASVWRGLAPAGSPCGPGIESFVCDDASTCVLDLSFCGTCQPTAPVGASCEEDRCEATASCVDGTCVARGLPGEPCGDELRCVPGASCVEGTCEAPLIVGVDEACDAGRRCPYKSACIGGRCVETGLLGEQCGTQQPCASGWCDDGACAPLKAPGQPCEQGVECVSGACDAVCQDLPGVCFE